MTGEPGPGRRGASVDPARFLRRGRPGEPASPHAPGDQHVQPVGLAIGPSLAVALVAVSLLPLFSTPAVLTRIGLVGSAAFDVAAAGLAAGTQHAQLAGPSYTQKVFAIGFAAMTLGGLLWMLTALVLTPILSKGDKSLRSVNPAVMMVVPAAALHGAFFTLAFSETVKSSVHLVTLLVSAVAMGVCILVAKYLKKPWLHEWGLGIAIVVALGVAYVITAT